MYIVSGVGGGGGGSGDATSIQGIPVDPTAPSATGQVLPFDAVAGVYGPPRLLTQDEISAGLSVVLSGGGGGTFECGATWTPGAITCSPACNAAGVTAASTHDTDGGNVNVLGHANPLSPPSATYTKTASSATEQITVQMTKGGVTKTSNAIVATWIDRFYTGQSTAGDCTGATSAGNDATLTGGSASGTLTGTLSLLNMGTAFNVPASAGEYFYLWAPHTAAAMTFADSNNQPFPMARVATNVAFSNQFAVAHGFDLYVSNPLTQGYTVHRAT